MRGSKSPSSPSPPGSDFAAQFDSLWNTFGRQYSYFDYKHIDWNALKDRFRPMAIAAGGQASFMGVVRQMLSALHDQHVVIRARHVDAGARRLGARHVERHCVHPDWRVEHRQFLGE